MSKPENLIKVGNAVLTPQAIKFLELLQTENNSTIKEYSKTLSELVSGIFIILHQGDAAADIIERIKSNAGEIASLAFELERLCKP